EDYTGARRKRLTANADNLDVLAEELNKAYNGEPMSQNVQAIVETTAGEYVVFVQREYKQYDEVLLDIATCTGKKIDQRVIGDQRDDESIHAEMLAVSWRIQRKIPGIRRIGISRPACSRCSAILRALGIPHRSDHAVTQSWVHPCRHAGIGEIDDFPLLYLPLRALPQKVYKSRETPWPDAADW